MTDVIVTPDAPTTEIPPEIVAAAAEAAIAQAEASVEIAEVHAEAATEQTAIVAEAQVAQAEIAAEVAQTITREELDECRRNSETALTVAEETRSLVLSISERLPPPPPNPTANLESGEGAPQAVEPQAESPPEPKKKKPAINWT